MSRWSELVAAALLGTLRAPVPSLTASGASLDLLLDQLEGDTPERRLLAAAALLTIWGQAGVRPLVAHKPFPTPAPSDERPPCLPRAAQYLARILNGDMEAMLPEWLEALASAGRVLPHRWLPELLTLACQKDDLRALILPLLDARGRWLAAQHCEWRGLLVPVEPEAMTTLWETGSHQERLALLRHLRITDPPRSHVLLDATWAEEPARKRAAFLTTFAIGLDSNDELFLENRLDDRSKQVRITAADLLARLPASRLVSRMKDRLSPLLSLEHRMMGRSRLKVTLPQTCDREMVRDGIQEQPPAGLGQRSWWLLQMLGAVPPATWSLAWEESPSRLVALAGKAEHGPVLLDGWSQAAARHRDGEWAEALLHCWDSAPWAVLTSGESLYFLDSLDDLLLAVPQERLEKWLVTLVRACARSLAEADFLLTLLSRHRRPWGTALTRAVIGGLRSLAGKRRSSAVRRWWAAMPDMARYMSPAVADEAERGWPDNGWWTAQIDRFLAILRFRQVMLESLR